MLLRKSSAQRIESQQIESHMVQSPPLDHEAFLRRSFDVARRARTRGNHPFGAILVSASGEVLIETENSFMPDRDMTGHAERVLSTQDLHNLNSMVR